MTSLLQRMRARLKPHPDPGHITDDVSPEIVRIYEQVRPYTMTNLLRVNALAQGVRHVVKRSVPGALVECGVWRGGSVLAMLLMLRHLGVTDRDVHLYDTFEGMTQPGAADTSAYEPSALETWQSAVAAGFRAWHTLFAPETFNLEQVRQTILSSGYPAERIHFIRGDVRDTLPGQAPGSIALLRLDTDWYESTHHELVHLYPRLVDGGVLIVDDYGHWDGCRRAVDEYFAQDGVAPVLLNRVDYTARLAIKH